jgi:hypothetical protein
MKTGRSFARTLAAVAALALAGGTAWAAQGTTGKETTGKVSIESMSVAAGLGYAWGNGVLEYRGAKYPFTVTAFSIVDVGVAKVFANGDVFNLKNVEDFEGMFMAAIAGASLGGGAGAAAMQNQNYVSMVWTATNQGLNFSMAHAGLNVKFTPEARQQAARIRKTAEGQPAAAPRTTQ